MDFPETEACRLLALNDGTIINQSPVAKKLCTMKSLQSSRLKIARDFLDGRGTVYGFSLPVFFKKVLSPEVPELNCLFAN